MKLFISLVVIFAVGVHYFFKHRYWVYIPAFFDHFKYPVGPNIAVNWNRPNGMVGRADKTNKPNIVVILADDLGFNDISFYGGGFHHGNISTPHIDSIGKNGVAFNNAYAGHATCAPSRAALLTGRMATKLGYEFTPASEWGSYVLGSMLGNGALEGIYHRNKSSGYNFDRMSLPASAVTIPESLREADPDYRSLYLGKWHNGISDKTMKPVGNKFDESLAFSIISQYLPKNSPDAEDCPLDDVFDQYIRANAQYVIGKEDGPLFAPKGYLTDYLAEEAAVAIEHNKENPFLLFLSLTAVHTPLTAKKKDYDSLSHIQDHCERVYAAMIVAMDRAVGTVLQALEVNGLTDNTMVIFTSDNGQANYVNLRDVNKPYRGWKGTLFEGGIHVPMLLKWPNKVPKGLVFDPIVSHVDLLPTIVSSVGGTVEHETDGTDIISRIIHTPVDGSTPTDVVEDDAVTEHVCVDDSKTHCFHHVGNNSMSSVHETLFWRSGDYMAIRKDLWKLQISGIPDKKWLYNLEIDQSERNNLADNVKYKEILDELTSILLQVNSTQAQPIWPALSETPVLLDKFLLEKYEDGDEYVYWPN